MYCWRRTVGWSQQLSRGSFDPRQEPQEKLKAKKRILGFRNWFLLLDMMLIWNLSRVWLRLGARPAFRYRRFCALDNYTPADLHQYVDTVFRNCTWERILAELRHIRPQSHAVAIDQYWTLKSAEKNHKFQGGLQFFRVFRKSTGLSWSLSISV